MATPKKALRTLMDRLPGHSEAIERAYAESERFRSICADFVECSRALDYWESMESRQALVKRAEYRQLFKELKQEILSWLNAR